MWLAVLLLSVGLVGCAATLPPPVVMPEPPRDLPQTVAAEDGPSPLKPPIDVSQLMASEPLTRVSPAAASSAVAAANQHALVRPNRSWFQGATLIYPYDSGHIYAVPTKDQSPTRLTFDSPEQVIKVHFMEDEWFDITLLEREAADQPDSVVIIPKAPKLKKDLLIITTQHAYTIALESHATTGLVHVRWAHQSPVMVPKPVLPSGLYYAHLAITPVHGSPPWTPVAAWAVPAVAKTLVQFPPAMKRFGMPVIKAIGADGMTKETMNWRVKGEYVEIDRFFQVAEVRFGHSDVAVVRISQTEAMTAIYCPGTDGCPRLELAR